MQVPITLYAEMTPNPSTMKFVSNKHLVLSDNNIVFENIEETRDYSPLAEALFNFPFVDGVFMASNFITITKTDNVDWDFIVMELREFIRDWMVNGKEVLIRMPEPGKKVEKTETKAELTSPFENAGVSKRDYAPTEYDNQIIGLLNEYVRPAVENDGGAIDFIGFEDGKVYVELKGSCAGCPSSTATLKGGIETLLRSNMPVVEAVVAVM